MAPEATRAPPAASTEMNAHWMDRPAVLPAIAHHQGGHEQQQPGDGAMLAQVGDQAPDDQRQGQAGHAGEQAQRSPGQQRPAVRPYVAVHDPPASALPASSPCLGGHQDLRRMLRPSGRGGIRRPAKRQRHELGQARRACSVFSVICAILEQ